MTTGQVHPATDIALVDLSIGYENRILFERLNLVLTPGKLVCLMGPNGSGKSSLIRCIAGLQRPLGGTVRYADGPADNLPAYLSLVLTDRVPGGTLTVHDLVTFGRYPYLGWHLRLQQHDRDQIDFALRRAGVYSLKDRRLAELSDGQVQMAMIARALAQDTPVIILDEPTAHLDLNNRVEVMNLLRSLAHENGKLILLATHELDLALQTADVIWLTGDGKDILHGIPEDLVLNGAFDRIFAFKGFDLKTGKVKQRAWRRQTVRLTGDDFAFLWTRNALERTGFAVVAADADADASVAVIKRADGITWSLDSASDFSSIQSLTAALTARE